MNPPTAASNPTKGVLSVHKPSDQQGPQPSLGISTPFVVLLGIQQGATCTCLSVCHKPQVGVSDAVVVPLFVEDPDNSFGSLMKKAAAISTGGWWLGGTHMVPNEQFLAKVRV